MKTNPGNRRGFTLVELLVVIAIIATLAGVGVPAIISQRKKGDRTEATQNVKSIGLAMFNFDQDYGSYPSEATGKEVAESNPESGMKFGTEYSNDFFRQLIAAGYIDSEKSFYAKGAYTKKPDNVMTENKALAAGEVGFAYVMASATEPLSSSGNSGRPLLVASVNNGLTDGTFDPDVYDRKAVVYRLDSSAAIESIRPSDKRVVIGGGKTLMQGGDKDTVWGTDITPILKAPQKSGGS